MLEYSPSHPFKAMRIQQIITIIASLIIFVCLSAFGVSKLPNLQQSALNAPVGQHSVKSERIISSSSSAVAPSLPGIENGQWTNRPFTEQSKQEILAAHNKYRAELKLPFLQWDEALAKSAQEWAYRVRNAHTLTHSPRGGENLWGGTKGAFNYTQMVDSWGEEKRFYATGVFPEVATQGRGWMEVGHYTQMIWRNTARVGCATASNDRRDYLVCHYDPVGNIIGQNVAIAF